MQHKLIMENWRRYEQYHDIFENKEYITEFLGIPLPLNESGYVIYSDPLREQIVKEHLLFEGLFQSIGNYIKDKTAPMRDLMSIIYKIMKDKNTNLMNAFMNSLNKNIIKPIAHKMNQMLSKVKLRSVFQWIDKNVIQSVGQLSGIRKLINLAGLAVFMRMGYEKLSGLLGDVIDKALDASGASEAMEAAKEPVMAWLRGIFQEPWQKIKEAVAKLVDVEKWIQMIGPLVGGVAKVAAMLVPATKNFAKASSEISPEDAAGREACKQNKNSPECQEYRQSQAGEFNRDKNYA